MDCLYLQRVLDEQVHDDLFVDATALAFFLLLGNLLGGITRSTQVQFSFLGWCIFNLGADAAHQTEFA